MVWEDQQTPLRIKRVNKAHQLLAVKIQSSLPCKAQQLLPI